MIQTSNPHAPATTAVQPTQPAPIRGGAMGVVQSSPAPANALAARIANPLDAGPMVPKYRVVQGGFCRLDQATVPIRAGKLLDETQYDLAELTRQGIRLELVELSAPVSAIVSIPMSETLSGAPVE
jgi:hypothetical protein